VAAALALAALASAAASQQGAAASQDETAASQQETAASRPEPAAGRDGDTAPAETMFFESLDVNVVNVEVYVTDRRGEPVSGLGRDDFELYEDGHRVPITNFYAVAGGRRTEPGAGEAAPAPEPPPAPEAPAAEPAPAPPPPAPEPVPEDQRLHLIVYFDNLQLRPFDRNRVAREVRGFLSDHVAPGDRTMVVTYERSLHVRQPFTDELERVFDALDGIEKLTGYAVQNASERDAVLRRVDSASTLTEAEGHVEGYATAALRDVEDSIGALEELVGSLGGLAGRKALLYVSDGIEMTAGDDLFHMLDVRWPEQASGRLMAGRYSARGKFRELVARANANRVTFYTIGAGGATAFSSVSAERGGTNRGGSLLEAEFVRQSNLTEPLQMMALDTGGQAVFNTNNIAGGLERLAADFRSFYSLGYVPAHHGDGRYHTLKVEVRRPGVEVRHRNGYRDKTLETRISEGALAALLPGAESDPFGLRIETAAARPHGDGYFVVPVEVHIPLGKVTLVPQGDLYRGRLRVVVAAAGNEGQTSPPEQTPIPIEIPAADFERARGQYYVYAAELLMRPGLHEIAVGVRDELAGETAFVRKPVYVGS
jgi:VWFA-related protein